MWSWIRIEEYVWYFVLVGNVWLQKQWLMVRLTNTRWNIKYGDANIAAITHTDTIKRAEVRLEKRRIRIGVQIAIKRSIPIDICKLNIIFLPYTIGGGSNLQQKISTWIWTLWFLSSTAVGHTANVHKKCLALCLNETQCYQRWTEVRKAESHYCDGQLYDL